MAPATSFDHVIASAGRLRILAALASQSRMDFVGLRKSTKLTDGNLATHTKRLESAGFVTVEKSFKDRKPVTHVCLTDQGRSALERHARDLLAVLGFSPATGAPSVRGTEVMHGTLPAREEENHHTVGANQDDWID